ncbi:MAG TPA: hypothetical protein VIJ07_03060 [Dermatophilaceae bacterium]
MCTHPQQVPFRHRGDVAALDLDPARGGTDQPGQQCEQGRLAGPGRPDQRHRLAALHAQVDLLQAGDLGVLVAVDVSEPGA